MINLHSLPKLKGKIQKSKRVGRGYGSGKGGHTAGRGTKGQKARSKVRLGFEGGQNPLYKALPKTRGFKPISRQVYTVVNINDLERKFKSGAVISRNELINAGLIKKQDRNVKILADGEIKKKFTIKGMKISKSAKEKIEKAGGKIEK